MVLATRWRRQLCQSWVHRAAMVTLGVVLEEQFPVRLYLVLDGFAHRQLGQVKAVETADQRFIRQGKGLRLSRQIDEHEFFPALDRHRVERVVGFRESFDVSRRRCPDQTTIQGIGPCMVGALNRLGEAARMLLAEAGAAVATHVVIGTNGARLISQYDDAFTAYLLQYVITGI